MLAIYDAMQKAVDIVNTSEHSKNKIAACLFSDQAYTASVNRRPASLSACFTPDIRIGKSSQFIHSEVASIFQANFKTEGASLCVTDPFCPNCAKAIVEAGIRHVYIDHKGLAKDFAVRRGDDFANLSLFMMEKAGIHVSILYRKDQKTEELINPPIRTRPAGNDGIEFFDIADDLHLADMIHSFRIRQAHGSWACAKVREPDGRMTGILVFEHLPTGITLHEYEDKKTISDKYTLTVDPVNRLLFYIRRKGLSLPDLHIGCNLFPSSRAMVNAVGFGITAITVGETVNKEGLLRYDGAKLLHDHGILTINQLY